MNIPEIIRIISLVLAPVVMVSCCIQFLNGQLSRYDGISSRMRAMNQERFDILRDSGADVENAMETVEGLSALRLREIEAQLPHLLKRHKMIHSAAVVIGLAILNYVISMFILALAAILSSSQIGFIALLSFLLATTTVLFGGTLILLEIYQSHRSVRYEVLHALSLGKRAPSLTFPHRKMRVPVSS